MIVDRCGNCLRMDDSEFNNKCTAVKSVFPHSSPDTGAEIVTVYGAGLSPRMSCSLEKPAFKYALSFVRGREIINLYNPSKHTTSF